MKKLILLTFVILFANRTIAQSQEVKAENLGLVSELVYIKLTSENLAIRIVNDTVIKETEKIKFVNLYNDVKVITDQVVLQLIADSRRKNNLRYFKKLDHLFVAKTISQIEEADLKKDKLKGYIKNLKKINAVYSKLMAFTTENPLAIFRIKAFFPSTISGEELTGVLSFVTATIKDIRESREKKVEKITTLLNDVRLSSLDDLIKGKKKEEENKKEEEK